MSTSQNAARQIHTLQPLAIQSARSDEVDDIFPTLFIPDLNPLLFADTYAGIEITEPWDAPDTCHG